MEESISFPEGDAVDDLYQPIKLEKQHRTITLGDEDFTIRAEVEADLFEIAVSKLSEASPLRCFIEEIVPLLLDDIEMHVIKGMIETRQIRPVQVLKEFTGPVEKMAAIIEARAKSIQKKRRELPK